MLDELAAAEQKTKKARVEKQEEEVRRWQQTEQIKEEGRRMREEREREMKKMEEDRRKVEQEEEMEAPSLGESARLLRKLFAHFCVQTPSIPPSVSSTFSNPIQT
jgi:DnaJ family protein C protein 17